MYHKLLIFLATFIPMLYAFIFFGAFVALWVFCPFCAFKFWGPFVALSSFSSLDLSSSELSRGESRDTNATRAMNLLMCFMVSMWTAIIGDEMIDCARMRSLVVLMLCCLLKWFASFRISFLYVTQSFRTDIRSPKPMSETTNKRISIVSIMCIWHNVT